MMKSLVLVAIVAALVAVAAPVASFPGYDGPMPSAMDAGYITVDEAHGRRLFYIFVESQRSPATDPVLIWLNGGPGCSSMYGFFTEHGPFKMNFTSQGHGLVYNPYTITTVANVIYLDSPAGVGFSSSNVSSDYTTGDFRTARDSYTFLQGFFKKFPQFRKNEFWVTGESYGGHYVPELVRQIRETTPAQGEEINLVGLMAGNPWTDPEREAFGVTDNWWDRAIISRQSHDDINNNCDYKDITFWIINNVSAGSDLRPNRAWVSVRDYIRYYRPEADPVKTAKCFHALHETSQVQFAGVNILGVYLTVCNQGTVQRPEQPNPCSGRQMTTYLNLPEVQAALHVTDFNIEWEPCSSFVSYNETDTQTSVLPIYQSLMDTQMHILVFSGDNDAIVPYTGTRRWIEALNRSIVNDTHEWYSITDGPQVGGWATRYDRLTFTTVRAAGHMVAYKEPERFLHMFNTFVKQHYL